jgi:hypothetical protein
MWRWHWKKYGGLRMGKILLDSAASIDKWRSVLFLWGGAFLGLLFISTPLGDAVMSTWHLLPSWTVPVFLLVSLAILFVRGLVKANYEEFRRVEGERDQEQAAMEALQEQIATEEQRATLKELLAEAIREGEELLKSRPSIEQAEEWVNKIGGVLQIAFLDTSEAQVFYSDEGLPPLYYSDPVVQHAQTPAQKWIRQRLARLTDLIRRADSLQIRPGFNGRDYIVSD